MKSICPVCGNSGFLQVRGKNTMIQHYAGFQNGRRLYTYHKVPYEYLQVNGASNLQVNSVKTLQVKDVDLSREAAKRVRRVGFEPTNPYGIGASGLRL
jgi:hypothetical protein